MEGETVSSLLWVRGGDQSDVLTACIIIFNKESRDTLYSTVVFVNYAQVFTNTAVPGFTFSLVRYCSMSISR